MQTIITALIVLWASLTIFGCFRLLWIKENKVEGGMTFNDAIYVAGVAALKIFGFPLLLILPLLKKIAPRLTVKLPGFLKIGSKLDTFLNLEKRL
jgi:hypothetical protein